MSTPDDNLVTRRSKRATAGNRMEAALAELGLESLDPSEDPEVDNDFVGKDEDDLFESDFASTDDEADKEDAEAQAGDKAVLDEERRARKTVRSRTERAIQGAAQRQRVTFNPRSSSAASSPVVLAVDRETSQLMKPKPKQRRRVSMGAAVDAETGETVDLPWTEEGEATPVVKKRQSRRQSTMQNTSQTFSRVQESETRKATLPRRAKTSTRAPTQAELIARALEMEDGNVDEHRNYLSLEEEKRQRAKVVRTAVKGPLLRWVSRAEEVACGSSAQPSSIPLGAQATGSFYTMEEGVSRYGWAYTGWAVGSANGSPDAPFALNPAVPASSVRGTEIHGAPSAASWPPIHPGFIPVLWPPPNSGPGVEVVPSQIPQPAVPRKEKVTRNYLIHELGQTEQTPWPTWKESMEAIFGNHVRWEDLRVYTGKGRPLARPIRYCPLTGLPAKYMDPRTGVPFANLRAYQTLIQVLKHDFAWSEAAGCYVGKAESAGVREVDGAPHSEVMPVPMDIDS